jgi:hypothetical protein
MTGVDHHGGDEGRAAAARGAVSEVIQLSRKSGWRKPEGVVTVARPTRWGNPFVVGKAFRTPDGIVTPTTRAESVELFTAWVVGDDPRAVWIREHLHELAGRTLACWCPQPGPCHALVLARMANGEESA